MGKTQASIREGKKHKVPTPQKLAKKRAATKRGADAAKLNGGATTNAWNTSTGRTFCKALKERSELYEAFASVNDDFKCECLDDPGYATDVITSMGMVAGRPEAEGRTNWVVRIDHRQKVKSAKKRDGGPAGDRVNAKMAELLTLYKIDELIADPKYAHIFNRWVKVAEQVRSIRIGQYLAAVHTEMVIDHAYSWQRAMDGAKCFYGKRKNKFFELERPATPEEREELVDLSHYKDVQGILDVFKPAWDEQKALPGGKLVVYSNRGKDRFSVWNEYPFEASSADGLYSDLGSDLGSDLVSSYTAGKLPAVVLKHYREQVASVPDFIAPTMPASKIIYDWFAAARGSGLNSPRTLWGKAWQIFFDDGTTIGRLDD